MSAGCNSSSPGHAHHEAESLPHRARHREPDPDHPDPVHGQSSGERHWAEKYHFLWTLVRKYQELSQRHFGLIAKTIALVVGQITLWKLQSSRKFYQIVLLEAKPMSTSHIKQFLKLTDTLPVFTKKIKSTKATISDNSSNFLNWQKIKQLK